MAVSATTKAPRVFFRGLQGPDGLAAILTNPGPECRATVTFRGAFAEVPEVLAGRRLRPALRQGASEIEITLPPGGVCVLRAKAQ